MTFGHLLVPTDFSEPADAALQYAQVPADQLIAEQVVTGHARAIVTSHLIEVASSDQHTVKPWLSARLPFSPTVTDLSSQGFELVGGRLDYLGGEPVATLVYKRREHVIDVYVSRGERKTRGGARDGFNLESFSAGGLRYLAVSDLNRNELADFARLLEKASSAS